MIIITNNELINNMQKDIQIKIIDGDVKDVIFDARDKILNGMELVADPLAGRKARPNPYLSVVLKDRENLLDQNHIIRLEELLKIYYKNINVFKNMSSELKEDFKILDMSLTNSVFY